MEPVMISAFVKRIFYDLEMNQNLCKSCSSNNIKIFRVPFEQQISNTPANKISIKPCDE
jgi:hypothetical protein